MHTFYSHLTLLAKPTVPLFFSVLFFANHRSSRYLCTSVNVTGLFSTRGSRNFLKRRCALEETSLKSFGCFLIGIALQCHETYLVYRGSSMAAFCQGRHPVKHTNTTIANCHTSWDVSALETNYSNVIHCFICTNIRLFTCMYHH